MTWKPLLWVVHHLLGLVVVVAFALFIGARNRRPAKDLGDGRIEFAPSIVALGAGAMIVIFFAYQSIGLFRHSHGKPLNFVMAACPGLLALSLLFGFPGTLVISSDHLQQVRWLWRNNCIRWKDIIEINAGKKSRTVTVTSADGKKIVHSRQLADRPRFLLELKQHCGENLPPDFPRESIASPRSGPPV